VRVHHPHLHHHLHHPSAWVFFCLEEIYLNALNVTKFMGQLEAGGGKMSLGQHN